MPVSDGPFGTAPDIGIGFSDAALLAVSLAGFGFLAMTVYSIVLQRLKSREQLEKEEIDDEKKYEEQLAQADVATLTRAQRRARARQIMKQQRRAAPAPTTDAAAPGAEGEGQLVALQPEHDGRDNDDAHHPQTTLSRKERQRLAKLAEKEERKLLEEERRKQQEAAQKEAQQAKLDRQKEHARLQEEERKRQQQERKQLEEAKQRRWQTFVEKDDKVLLVEEWLEQCKINRYVNLLALADEYSVSTATIRDRIQRLVHEKRVIGVFTPDETVFVVFRQDELKALADLIGQKGCLTITEIAEWMNATAPIPSATR